MDGDGGPGERGDEVLDVEDIAARKKGLADAEVLPVGEGCADVDDPGDGPRDAEIP